jgi:hypothetical protein
MSGSRPTPSDAERAEPISRPLEHEAPPSPENSKERLDERLDEAEEESFPASDPIAVHVTR